MGSSKQQREFGRILGADEATRFLAVLEDNRSREILDAEMRGDRTGFVHIDLVGPRRVLLRHLQPNTVSGNLHLWYRDGRHRGRATASRRAA